jgi:hypothetical protein
MDIEGRVERLESNLDKLVSVVSVLPDQVTIVVRTVGEIAGAQKRSEEAHKANEEALNVLVRMMDEWIRNSPRTSPPAS